ncbi:hypothetical protein SS50377_20034 [Spironucleus salmonicida]|uniref:Uncharacterized protein n=1 Tax=Spironucleus salmonicida TaxID=348837 RepID=A0A9P8LZ81_9EUKA|nr:hypothetical protein SS50377_20034 [Spironucleus salmonicida]
MHEQNNLLQSQVIDYLQELRLQQIQIIEYTKRHENLCLFEEDYQLLQEQYQQLIIQRDELQKQLEVRGSASQEYSEGGRGSEKDSIIAGLQADVELISAEAGRMEQQLLEQTQTLDQVQIALQTAQQDNSQLAEMLQASQEQAKTAEEYKARCIVLPAEARDLYLFQQSTSNGEVSLVKLTQLSERVSHQEQLQQELALVQLDKHTLEVELAKTIAEHNQLQKQLEVRGSASQEYSEGGRGSEKDSIIAGLQADVELISAEAGRMEQQLLEQTQTLDQVQIALQTAQQDNSQLAEMLQASQEQAKTAEEYKARCIVLPAEARDLYLFQQSTSNGEVSLVKLTQLSERVSHQEQLQQELALVQLDKHTLEVELAKTIAEHNQLQKQLEVRGSASQEYSEGGRGSEKDSIIAGLQADVELISAEAGRMEQQLLEQTQTLDQVQIALQTAQQDNSQLAEMLQASQEQAKTAEEYKARCIVLPAEARDLYLFQQSTSNGEVSLVKLTQLSERVSHQEQLQQELALVQLDKHTLEVELAKTIAEHNQLQKQLEVRGSASQEYSEGGRGSEKDSIIAGLQADVELISAEAGRMEQQLLEQTQTLDQVQIALQTAQQDNSQLAEMLQASQEQAKTAEEYKARCIVLPAEARDVYLFQQSTSNGEVSLVKLTQLSERVSHQEQLQQELALVQLDKHTLEVELAKTIAEHNQLQKQLEVRGSASQEYSEGGRGSEKDSIIAGLQADVELISAEAGRMEQQLLEQTQTLDQVQIALQTAQQDNSQLAEMLQASQEQAKTNGLKQCVTCKINLDKIQKLKIDRKELTKIIQQFQILLKENTIIKNEQLLDDVYKPGFDVNQKFSIDQFTKFLYYSKDQEKQQINYLSSSIHSSHQKYQEQKQLNIKLRTYIDLQKQQIQNQDSQLEQYNSTASLKVSFIEKPEIINSSQNINLQSQQSDLNNNFKEYNGSQIISSPILQEIQKEIQ